MNRFPTPLRLAAVLLTAAALSSVRAQAQFFVTVDTVTELTGTFSEAGGPADAFSDANFYFPAHFAWLPQGLFLVARRYTEFGATYQFFETVEAGSPDNPYYAAQGLSLGTSLSGTYTNGGSGRNHTVNWSITNLEDTAPENEVGTFSGSFSFVLYTPVPEPAETAAVIGLALSAFALVRRSRRG